MCHLIAINIIPILWISNLELESLNNSLNVTWMVDGKLGLNPRNLFPKTDHAAVYHTRIQNPPLEIHKNEELNIAHLTRKMRCLQLSKRHSCFRAMTMTLSEYKAS